MEQVLIIVVGAILTFSSVVLGAILAIGGGFLHQMYQNRLTLKRDDRAGDRLVLPADLITAVGPWVSVPG